MGSLLVLGRVPLVPYWTSFCCFFHYPPKSSGALLAGSLPLRYCSAKFASRIPFWALPVPGHVAGLITDGVQAAQVGEAAVVRRGVDFVGVSGLVETISTTQKNHSTPRGLLCAFSSTSVEEVASYWVYWCL